jgi:hypothetical protein
MIGLILPLWSVARMRAFLGGVFRYLFKPWSLAALAGLVLFFVLINPPKRKPPIGSDWFPQNQMCQSDSVAFKIRFPYKRKYPHHSPFIPNPEAVARAVTNCARFGFNFFLQTSEVTHLQYWYQSHDKFYGINELGNRDLVVHVSHVQPADSLGDPTLETNLYLLTMVRDLTWAYHHFDGARTPIERYGVDEFFPGRFRTTRRLYFLNRPETAPEFVGRCDVESGRGSCRVLTFSRADRIAMELTFPYAELERLNEINSRTIELIRRWRVP